MNLNPRVKELKILNRFLLFQASTRLIIRRPGKAMSLLQELEAQAF